MWFSVGWPVDRFDWLIGSVRFGWFNLLVGSVRFGFDWWVGSVWFVGWSCQAVTPCVGDKFYVVNLFFVRSLTAVAPTDRLSSLTPSRSFSHSSVRVAARSE